MRRGDQQIWRAWVTGPLAVAVAALWLGLLPPLVRGAGAVTTVSSAGEICPEPTDPCIIGDTAANRYDILDGSVLDFGTREVRLLGNNALDFGSGTAVLRCGRLVAEAGVGGNPVLAHDSDGGADVTLEALRSCSISIDRRCLDDSECALGSCSAHTCLGDPDYYCGQDSDCQLGICRGRRCANDDTRPCLNDVDCDLGNCGAATFCEGSITDACSTDDDCFHGACSIGSGTIDYRGGLAGQNARIVVRASDDAYIDGAWNVSYTPDGGRYNAGLTVRSGFGDLEFAADANLNGFGAPPILFTAGRGVTVSGKLQLDAGFGRAGDVTIFAGEDVVLTGDLYASGTGTGASGGWVTIDAGGFVRLGGDDGLTRLWINGADQETGCAGRLRITAGGDIVLHENLRLQGRSHDCNRAGRGELTLTTPRTVLVDGNLDLAGSGGFYGAGASFAIDAGEYFSSAASIVTLTGAEYGGSLDLATAGSTHLDGSIDVRSINYGGPPGKAGTIHMTVGGDLELGGSLRTDGEYVGMEDPGSTEIAACRIHLLPGAEIRDDSSHATVRLSVGESLRADLGSTIEVDGTTPDLELRYRDAAKPPVLAGDVFPVPTLLVVPELPGCPVCGNGEIDQGESCDDGNTTDGDGCDAICLSEGTTTTSVSMTTSTTVSTTLTTTTSSTTTTTTGAVICGDGNVHASEACDEGAANSDGAGVWCTGACRIRACGLPVSATAPPKASDALFVLRAAVGTGACDKRVCDANGSGTISAGDALLVLQAAVGASVAWMCPT